MREDVADLADNKIRRVGTAISNDRLAAIRVGALIAGQRKKYLNSAQGMLMEAAERKRSSEQHPSSRIEG
jgi:hypothetical protein